MEKYMMDECVFPDWLSIVAKIENDLFQNRDILHTQLYHYTSIDGFMSIMQNRDFWISNIHYMNDSQEFENGKSICKKVINMKLQNGGNQKHEFLYEISYDLLNIYNVIESLLNSLQD